MRRAVVHVNLDPAGVLTVAQLSCAVDALRRAGFELIAGELDKLPPRRREVELLHEGDEVDELRRIAERACAAAVSRFQPAANPSAQAVTFISSGSHEDALGIVRAFGLEADVKEIRFVGEEVAVMVVSPEALRREVSAKLQTALESALNREVQLSVR